MARAVVTELAGRDAQYAAFVESTWDRYLRLCRLLTGDAHRAEDLLQDSYVKLYVRWRKVTAHGDPNAYLRRMLVNGNATRWRRDRREQPVDVLPDREAHHDPLPEPHAELRRALLALPAGQRVVVVLRHYADLTEREVAQALGCSVGTVKSQHARAMSRLRDQLAVHPHREGTTR